MLQYEKDLRNCQYTNGIGKLSFFFIHTCVSKVWIQIFIVHQKLSYNSQMWYKSAKTKEK